MTFLLASSGGGGYAAALLFYFLQYMDTVKINHQQTILDRLSLMSVVSGSAVTGMDYALRGRKIFDDFEENFLAVNVGQKLRSGLITGLPRTLPTLLRYLFTRSESTRILSQFFENYYSQALYKNVQTEAPQVVVNVSCPEVNRSLYFTSEYLSMFGRNLSEFSVGHAVGIATSFIPQACGSAFESGSQENRQLGLDYLSRYDTEEVRVNFPNFWNKIQQLKSLTESNERYFLHLRDAGFSDASGMGYILELLLPGGDLYEKIVRKEMTKLVVFQLAPINPRACRKSLDTPDIPNYEHRLAVETLNALSSFVGDVVCYLLRSYEKEYGLKVYFIEPNAFILDDRFQEQLFEINPGSFGLTPEEMELIRKSLFLMLARNEEYQDLLFDLKEEQMEERFV